MKLGQEAADQQVVDVLRSRVSPELAAQVLGELLQVLGVGSQRVCGGVALVFEMTQERGDGALHQGYSPAAIAAAPPRACSRKRSRLASARSEYARRFLALSRTRSGSSGSRPKVMFVGW